MVYKNKNETRPFWIHLDNDLLIRKSTTASDELINIAFYLHGKDFAFALDFYHTYCWDNNNLDSRFGIFDHVNTNEQEELARGIWDISLFTTTTTT